jgi:hypothetical protein
MKDIILIFILNCFFILGAKEGTNYSLNNLNEVISSDYFDKIKTSKTFSIQKNADKNSVSIYTNNPGLTKLNGYKMQSQQKHLKLDSSQQLEVSGSISFPVIIYILFTKNGKIEINESQGFTFYAFLRSNFQEFNFLINFYSYGEKEIIIQSYENIDYNNANTYVKSSQGRISSSSNKIKIVPYQLSIDIEIGIKINSASGGYDKCIIRFTKSTNEYPGLVVAAQIFFYVGVFIFCVMALIDCCSG